MFPINSSACPPWQGREFHLPKNGKQHNNETQNNHYFLRVPFQKKKQHDNEKSTVSRCISYNDDVFRGISLRIQPWNSCKTLRCWKKNINNNDIMNEFSDVNWCILETTIHNPQRPRYTFSNPFRLQVYNVITWEKIDHIITTSHLDAFNFPVAQALWE